MNAMQKINRAMNGRGKRISFLLHPKIEFCVGVIQSSYLNVSSDLRSQLSFNFQTTQKKLFFVVVSHKAIERITLTVFFSRLLPNKKPIYCFSIFILEQKSLYVCTSDHRTKYSNLSTKIASP